MGIVHLICVTHSSSKFRTFCESKPVQLSCEMGKTCGTAGNSWEPFLCELLWGRRATGAMSGGLNGHHFPPIAEEPGNNPFHFLLFVFRRKRVKYRSICHA